MQICIGHAGDLSVSNGGTQRVTAFAQTLVEAGHEVAIVTVKPESDVVPNLAESPTELVTASIRRRGLLDQPTRGAVVVRKAIKEATKRDALLQFEHSTLAGLGTYLGASDFVLDMMDLDYPARMYGSLPLGGAFQRAVKHFEGRALRQAKHAIVVSERMRELVLDIWDVREGKLSVVPNGYDHRIIKKFDDADPIKGKVVFLGALHPKVDIETIIEIAIKDAVSEMLVVGGGPKLSALRSWAKRAGAETLQTTGWVSQREAVKLTATADVAVNPQLTSRLQAASSPVKLYLYAGLGLPIVVTSGPDAAKWLGKAGAATVIDEDGPFAEQVAEIIKNRPRRTNMAAKSQSLGHDARWEMRGKMLLDVYDSFNA